MCPDPAQAHLEVLLAELARRGVKTVGGGAQSRKILLQTNKQGQQLQKNMEFFVLA